MDEWARAGLAGLGQWAGMRMGLAASIGVIIGILIAYGSRKRGERFSWPYVVLIGTPISLLALLGVAGFEAWHHVQTAPYEQGFVILDHMYIELVGEITAIFALIHVVGGFVADKKRQFWIGALSYGLVALSVYSGLAFQWVDRMR